MREKTKKYSRWFVGPLLAAFMMLGAVGTAAQAAGPLGGTIDKNNVQAYRDILIPALYRAVERGDFVLQTAAKLPYEYKHAKGYLEAGEKNAGKFDVNPQGDLIIKGSATFSDTAESEGAYDKPEGKIPYYNIYGWPFPHVKPNEPRAAVKMMWNFMFNKYRLEGYHYQNRVTWIDDKKGEHRFIWTDSYEPTYTGRRPERAVTEQQNPNHWVKIGMGFNVEPFDMLGTNQLWFDYLDDRDVTAFAYVPSIRRIRQTSGVNRSDPSYGSDAWQDLGMLWDGKNRWMKWKLVGEKTVLVPFTNLEKRKATLWPDGTYLLEFPEIKYGYKVPGWKGAKWAPTNAIWVPRKVYVIEQYPKDKYYAWGLHVNYVDAETYQIWMKEVSDRTGAFRTWCIALFSYSEAPDGSNNVNVRDTQITIDEKVRHATAGMPQNQPGSDRSAMFIPNSRMPMKMFNKNSIMQAK